jgi:hypothetical protein
VSAPHWLRYSDVVRRGSIASAMLVVGCFGNPVEELTGSIGTVPESGDATTAGGPGVDPTAGSTADDAAMSETTATTPDGSGSGESTTGASTTDASTTDASTGETTSETSTGQTSESGAPAETTGEPPQDICADVEAVCPCLANNCCAEIEACVQFDACHAVVQCVVDGGPVRSCIGVVIPPGGDALAQCAIASCGGGGC